jgi:RHS repeat-associated protein
MKTRWSLAVLTLCLIFTGTAGYFLLRDRGGNPTPPPRPEPVEIDLSKDKSLVHFAPTTLAEATGFLRARQAGLKEGIIEAKRAAVLRGLVQTRDGSPLAGVKLSVHQHPEYGSIVTQTDGIFDLVVNGGGQLCVHYQKDGYLPACRHTAVPWQDYAWLPDAVLIPVDTKVTTVDLKSDAPIQVAQGSPVRDKDGERQATLLIPKGTEATMLLPDGSKKPLGKLNVRVTEYTVGPKGPAAMPAPLPPTSGYTYAFELSADEVIAGGVKVNGKDLLLNKPVVQYVENFLNFPVGIPVPTGYYDNHKAAWVASDNGRIIKVLAVTDGLAELDVEGKDKTADAKALAALGITDDERRQLATLYKPGQSLWRVPIPHFSTWDSNWGFGPPDDAKDPKEKDPEKEENTPDGCHTSGSLIDVHNQSLGESVVVTGTPFRLHYRSDRAPGRYFGHPIRISLSGDKVPKSLKRIELEIHVAGHRFVHSYAGKSNQSHSFAWDGKDAYGRHVAGQQVATVRIGYTYDGVYQRTERFGANGNGTVITGGSGRNELTLWQQYTTRVGGHDARVQGLGGWTLEVHHAHHHDAQVLYLGDGRRHDARAAAATIHDVTRPGWGGNFGGDGGPAIKAMTWYPAGLAVGPDGSLFIADHRNHRIRRVSPDGIMTSVAGSGAVFVDGSFAGDGGPATKARLYAPMDVTVAPDGSLYIADGANHRVRRVGPDGLISTVAGGGDSGADGIPAVKARLSPTAVAVGPDGSVYVADVADWGSVRVRRIGLDGRIDTVAGGGTDPDRNGIPATQAKLTAPYGNLGGLAFGPDGSLYLCEKGKEPQHRRVRRISPQGIITTVAGGGQGGLGDGGPATQAQINPSDVAVAPDGTLYIADYEHSRVRRVTPDGIITTIAGGPKAGPGGGGMPALQAYLANVYSLALAPDGSLFLGGTYGSAEVRRIASGLPGTSVGEITVPDESGDLLYVFDTGGRHQRTQHALTKAVLYKFDYDAEGRLNAVHDADGNITKIERDSEGRPTALVAPYGQRTTLTVNADGYLAAIANPRDEKYEFSYSAGGLMASMKDPNGHAYRFSYDERGRLAKDEHPAGGFTALARRKTDKGFEVATTTALKPPTTYLLEREPTGEEKRLNQCCCGAETKVDVAKDGTRTVAYPDGAILIRAQQPDPRWGMQTPLLKDLSLTTPAGIKAAASLERKVDLADSANPLSLKKLTDTLSVNGRKYTSTFDVTTRQMTSTTPAGRKVVGAMDERGRVIRAEIPGLQLPVRFDYDERGRLIKVTQGGRDFARIVEVAYDEQGRVASVTDPLKRTARFEYDRAGRVVKQLLPGGREVGYAYDANGNVKSIIPPSRPAHAFQYTAVNLTKDYAPPDVGAGGKDTAYEYNKDKQLTKVTRPDGKTVELAYDKVGHLETVTIPGGQIRLTFDGKTEQLKSITAPDGTLSFSYDGFLPTSTTWDGVIKGSVTRKYDNDFRVTAQSVNGGAAVEFKYDPDGLLTQAGAMTLPRDPRSGFLTATKLGNVSTTHGYNGFGERDRFTAKFKDKEIFTVQYERDLLGRIVTKTETIEGQTSTYIYDYDPAGRLTDVTKDGVKIAHYEYDSNGNRLAYKGQLGEFRGSYDAQDRLLAYGNATYQHTANGEWSAKTENGKTTGYDYDVFGNLRAVTLPDGTKIEYVIDAANRRVGKKVNGKLVQGFLYAGRLRPVAELDGQNKMVSRFVYGTRINVPEYMEKKGKTYRIVTDHLGSPRLVIDVASGEVVQRVEHDEFGNVIQDTSPGFQPFGFAGGLCDAHTKLIRFGYRDYDATTGRWTAKDPIGFAGESDNFFAYVNGDPMNHRDPSGLFWETPLDVFFFGESLGAYLVCPSPENALSLGLDAIGLLSPGPGPGTARRMAGAADDISDFARRLFGRGVPGIKRTITRQGGGGISRTVFTVTESSGGRTLSHTTFTVDSGGRIVTTPKYAGKYGGTYDPGLAWTEEGESTLREWLPQNDLGRGSPWYDPPDLRW